MKNSSVILTLACLLAACSAAPTVPEPLKEVQPPMAKAAKKPGRHALAKPAPAGAQSADPLPNVELTEDLLFNLLCAEISAQRGHADAAFAAYMAAAQQTRDPRLARRAAELSPSPEQTLAALRLWHQLAPHSEGVTQFLASVIILTNDVAGSRPILEELLKKAAPEHRGLLMLQIQGTLARAKDKAAAFALLDEVLKPYLSTLEAHIALAQGAYAAGDLERARAEALTAEKMQPDSQQAALTLAQVTPDKAGAEAALSDHLRSHPDAKEVRIAYARMLIEEEKYVKAREQFDALIKSKPDDAPSIYAAGVLAKQVGDTDAAEKYFRRFLEVLDKSDDDELDPTPALAALSQIAEDRNDIEGALKWLSRIDSEEAQFGVQLKRAQLTAKSGDLEGARKVLAGIKPEDPHEKIQLVLAESELLRDANRVPEAMKLLEDALKQSPNDPDLLYDYAMAAEKIDRIDVMESTLRHLIEIAPNNQQAYNALGYSLADRNLRLDEAFTLISKALQLAPEDPFIMDSMGWVEYKLGHLDEAEQYLQRAYKLKQDPEIAVHLGEVLWRRGHKAEAQKLWREAKDKDPKNDSLKSTLARLHATP